MSGTLETQIMFSRRRMARQQLAQLLPALQTARQQAESSRGAASTDARGELAQAIQKLREELRAFRTASTDRASMLEAVRTADAALLRISGLATVAPSAAALAACEAEIQGILDGTSSADIDSTRESASNLVAKSARAESLRAEIATSMSAVRRLVTAPAAPATAPRPDASREHAGLLNSTLLAATTATVDAEASAVAGANSDSLRLGEFNPAEHARAIESARKSLAKQDLDGASTHAAAARATRIAAEARAAEVRQQIEMRDELAGVLAMTLEQRNYDKCDAYLQPGPGGDERPLVIYANNPSNTAHVRLTLSLDGRMSVEVDGVAEGEEEICVDVLESFKKAVAESGDDFVVHDAGRAKQFMERLRHKSRQREQERERGR